MTHCSREPRVHRRVHQATMGLAVNLLVAALAFAEDEAARAAEQADISRAAAYEEFRAHYDAGRYAEALPLAEQVVELTESDVARLADLPSAYNNLGATRLKLGDSAGAEQAYQRALALLEASDAVSSRRPMVPLAGIGLASAQRGWHDRAIEYLDRAIATSRRVDGLFNHDQVPLIESLIDSYLAIGNFLDALRARSYVLQIAEQNYGALDARILPALYQLAVFQESVLDFEGAREAYARARAISEGQGGGMRSPGAIAAMIAIARTYRRQYLTDPESLEPEIPRDAFTKLPEFAQRMHGSRLPREIDMRGYRIVEEAVERLRAVDDPPPRLLADSLVELGDWANTIKRTRQARRNYHDANRLYERARADGGANPLAVPRLVIYQPPVVSVRNRLAPPQFVRLRKAQFSITVNEDGVVRNLTVVSSDLNDGQMIQIRNALQRALFSPRFEDGEAVATDGFPFTGEWFELDLSAGQP